MRIPALLASTLLALPAALAAQVPTSDAPAGPRVGILVGLSSATLSGSDVTITAGDVGVTKKRRTGGVAGVYATLPLAGSPVSLRPELLYAQKGVSLSADGVMGTTKLDYLELPVLLQLDVPNTSGFRPALYVGPSVAYRVKCSLDVSGGGQSTSSGCDNSGSAGQPAPRKFDVSGVVGGQLGFELGGQSLGVGVRYTQGFTNFAKDVDAKNRTFSVYGAVDFPFGR